MKIKNVSLFYEQGSYIYHQGISGKNNYLHQTGNKSYNGFGGMSEYTASKLVLQGISEDNRIITINVKYQILELFSRKKLGEKFVDKLNDSLPQNIELEPNSEGFLVISNKSLNQIYINFNKK